MRGEAIRILGSKHALPVLNAISEKGAVRFKDLHDVVRNETMRAQTLKTLRNNGLISSFLVDEKNTEIKLYEITERGTKILKTTTTITKTLT